MLCGGLVDTENEDWADESTGTAALHGYIDSDIIPRLARLTTKLATRLTARPLTFIGSSLDDLRDFPRDAS